MDVCTHALCGYVLGRTLFDHNRPGACTAVAIVASIAPDADRFIALFDVGMYLRVEGRVSHSVAGLLVCIWLAGAWATKWIETRHRPRVLMAAVAGHVGHVLLDSMTSWGTAFLWPFASARFSLDWVPPVDPVFTIILLATALLVEWSPKGNALKWGCYVACTYLALSAGLHCVAWQVSGIDDCRRIARVVPVSMRPHQWCALEDGYPDRRYLFSLLAKPGYAWVDLKGWFLMEFVSSRNARPLTGEVQCLLASAPRDRALMNDPYVIAIGEFSTAEEVASGIERTVFSNPNFMVLEYLTLYEVEVVSRHGKVVRSRFRNTYVGWRCALYAAVLGLVIQVGRRWMVSDQRVHYFFGSHV